MNQYFLYVPTQLQRAWLFLIIIIFSSFISGQPSWVVRNEIVKNNNYSAQNDYPALQIDLSQDTFISIITELFRLRNEHKADSLEKFYADTVLVYMKYLRNIPRKEITRSDKQFWKRHPKNKFVMTRPVEIRVESGITRAIVIGKEYPDGGSYGYERIEIKFDRNKKINS